MTSRRGRGPARAVQLRVCALQLAVPQPDRVPHLEALREAVLARLLQAAHGRPDLVVLPGLAALLPGLVLAARAGDAPDLGGLVRRHGPEATEIWLDWCRTYARLLDVHLCTGSGFVERDGQVMHAAWIVDRGGRVVLEQAQTHVTPREQGWGVVPGQELRTAELEGARVGLLVGADAFYPEVGRILALLGAWLWLSPQALPAPYDAWGRRAGAWSQVQGNQVYCVEACLVGALGGEALAGRSACLAPVELAPDGSGVLAAAPRFDGDAAVEAVLDGASLHALRREYPVFRHLNPALYARYLPAAYTARPAAGDATA